MAMFGRARGIHFVGVGGIGMSGIAELLVNLGYHISGSDARSTEITRRLAGMGLPLKVRTRAIDIAYRKPSFVGDRARCHLRMFDHQGALGAAGFVASDDGKPRSYIRILLGD